MAEAEGGASEQDDVSFLRTVSAFVLLVLSTQRLGLVIELNLEPLFIFIGKTDPKLLYIRL